MAQQAFNPKTRKWEDSLVPIGEKKDKPLLPENVPAFEYAAFESPAFNEKDIGFTERKASPLDLSGIMKQTTQRQAITGVEPSAAFVSGIAEPALREKTKEAIAFEELNRQRELEARKQAFQEYSVERGQRFQEYQSAKDIAFKQHAMEWEREIKEAELEIAKIQAEKKQDSGGGCIIVSACHGKYSEEVNITRQYRDKFLDICTLRGYYIIAEKIVPVMERNIIVKRFISDYLVRYLIEVGKYKLEMTTIKPLKRSLFIASVFLKICKLIGKLIPTFTRYNLEVI